jgi:hypothetical protein
MKNARATMPCFAIPAGSELRISDAAAQTRMSLVARSAGRIGVCWRGGEHETSFLGTRCALCRSTDHHMGCGSGGRVHRWLRPVERSIRPEQSSDRSEQSPWLAAGCAALSFTRHRAHWPRLGMTERKGPRDLRGGAAARSPGPMAGRQHPWKWQTLTNELPSRTSSAKDQRVDLSPIKHPRTPEHDRSLDAGSAVGCKNIRPSADAVNPLSRSRNWRADGDGCVGSHLMQVSRRRVQGFNG